MTRRTILAAGAISLVIATAIAVSGGFATSVGGVRVSARSPALALAAAVVFGAWWLAAAWRASAILEDLAAWSLRLELRAPAFVWSVAAGAGIAAFAFGTFSSAGADASGYLSQAAMWARGAWRVVDPLVALPGWPLAPADTAPLGWRPALEQGWQVPTYAPGLPLLMAVPYAIAGNVGATSVVVVAAAVAVWATGSLARTLGGSTAALVAAALLAASPTFLYQSLQPMSDVPVTAAWMVCWLALTRGRPQSAGVAAAIAALIRPNLAPLAAIPLLHIVLTGDRVTKATRAIGFSAPIAMAGVVIAWLQWRWYGSAFISGYGSPGELFALENIAANARLYAAWAWEAEPVAALAGLGALVLAAVGRARGRGAAAPDRDGVRSRSIVPALLTFIAGVVGAYLVYAVFERWSYLRFLLPAQAALSALMGVMIGTAVTGTPTWARGLVVCAVVVGIVAGGVWRARRLEVFHLGALNARAVEAGAALRQVLPANAVLLAGEQSGSMRHETGRPVIRWDLLDAPGLRRALNALRAHGLQPWWVLDQWEESRVRAGFAGVTDAALDRPPDVEAGALMRTRAWRWGLAP